MTSLDSVSQAGGYGSQNKRLIIHIEFEDEKVCIRGDMMSLSSISARLFEVGDVLRRRHSSCENTINLRFDNGPPTSNPSRQSRHS